MAGTKVKIAAGHEGNKEKVCAACGRKILDKDKKKLNYVQIDIIKEHIDFDFDIEKLVFLNWNLSKDVRFPRIQLRNLFFQI